MHLATILLLGSVQAAFLIVLILGKRRKTLPDWILASWMALLGSHHLLYFLFDRGLVEPSVWLNLNAGVPLLQGPFLYMYVQTLTSGRHRMNRRDLLHLIPFGLFAIYIHSLTFYAGQSGASHVSVFRLSILVTTAILISVPAYAIASLMLLRAHRTRTLAYHSETVGRDLSWLRWIVLALLSVWVVVIAVAAITYVSPDLARTGLSHQMMSAVTLFIYVIGYFGFRQIAVGEPEEPAGQPGNLSSVQQVAKYQRSGLKTDEGEALIDRLNRYLEEQKPYLEEGITLRQVASDLSVSTNHLSQAINQELNMNFYELINERRVEEFKRRVVDPENRAFTLLAIALDSGFTSKSSFNRVFKQFTGLSPKQYVERSSPSHE